MLQNSYIFNILKKEFEHDIQKSLIVFCCALLVVSILQYVVKNIVEISKLPPGPLGIWPFGILRFIGHEKHKSLMNLATTYGPLFSCKLGQQLYVVISDYKLIREIFKKESMTGRPKTPLYEVLNGAGVINAEGPLWKDQRRFLHEKLRRFGMTHFSNTNNKLQNMITSEISDLLSQLKNDTKTPLDLEPYFAVSVSNVVCNLLMSVRFTRNDPKFIRFNTMIEEGMRLFGKIQFSDYIPMTKYLPTFQAAKSQIADNRKEMFEFYREVIDEHRRTFDRNNIRDLVDFYLLEIEIAKESGTEDKLFNGREHDEQIMQVMGDLFSAGMETIKTTLLWLIVYMLRNPNAKKQVQDELDSVIGRQRMPKYSDLQYLPHTESTIYEVLRISSIVPLATTHSPLVDEELNGYKIPAGAHVVPLINSVHMNPELWKNPNDFNPTRFLNHEGKVQKPDFFIPFGVGRRMCLGDVLARMELFLFFSSIMHCFDIALPKGSVEPSLNGNPGVTIHPDNFMVCLKERPLDPITTDDQTPLRPFGSN